MNMNFIKESIKDIEKEGFKGWDLEDYTDTLEDVKAYRSTIKSKSYLSTIDKYIELVEEGQKEVASQQVFDIMENISSEKSTKTKKLKLNSKKKGDKKGDKKGNDKSQSKAKEKKNKKDDKKKEVKTEKLKGKLNADKLEVGTYISMLGTKTTDGAQLQVLDYSQGYALCKNWTDIKSPILLSPEDIKNSSVTINYPEEIVTINGQQQHFDAEIVTHQLIYA